MVIWLVLARVQVGEAPFTSPRRGEDGRGALVGTVLPFNAPSPHNDPANRLRLPLRGRECSAVSRKGK
jgi:hypothetical protein